MTANTIATIAAAMRLNRVSHFCRAARSRWPATSSAQSRVGGVVGVQ